MLGGTRESDRSYTSSSVKALHTITCGKKNKERKLKTTMCIYIYIYTLDCTCGLRPQVIANKCIKLGMFGTTTFGANFGGEGRNSIEAHQSLILKWPAAEFQVTQSNASRTQNGFTIGRKACLDPWWNLRRPQFITNGFVQLGMFGATTFGMDFGGECRLAK